jgi:hypothetical protein
MNTNMSRPPAASRCVDIRELLRDFAAERLGATATGEVRGHLLSCQGCSEAFGEILMAEVESGVIPLLTPPQIPPVEWYDAYMRAGSKRFGTFWKSVRDGFAQADQSAREWARARRDELEMALNASAGPAPMAIRTRGAVRTRGAAPSRGAAQSDSRSSDLMADVIAADGESTGAVVRFTIEESPHIESSGRFRLTLTTGDAAHDDRLVICTLTLPGAMVSFTGTLHRRANGDTRELRIDEGGLPGPARVIPTERVTFAVLES